MEKTSILPIIALLCMLAASPAAALEPTDGRIRPGWLYGVYAGVLAHDVDNLWSGTRREDGVDINAELVLSRPSLTLPAGAVRPNFGISVNDRGDTSKLYLGLLWEARLPLGLFINIGLGGAVHNGELESGEEGRKALGSRALFRIPVELGYAINGHHRVSVAFAHVSNAYLAHPNEGLDTLGLRYCYLF